MAKPILVDDLMALCLLGRNKTENISERGKRKESDQDEWCAVKQEKLDGSKWE